MTDTDVDFLKPIGTVIAAKPRVDVKPAGIPITSFYKDKGAVAVYTVQNLPKAKTV